MRRILLLVVIAIAAISSGCGYGNAGYYNDPYYYDGYYY